MANLQIKPVAFSNRHSGSQLEKRIYLPFVLTSTCPECGGESSRDLREQYLSYPSVGDVESVTFYHSDADEDDGNCHHEWREDVIVGFTLTEAKL